MGLQSRLLVLKKLRRKKWYDFKNYQQTVEIHRWMNASHRMSDMLQALAFLTTGRSYDFTGFQLNEIPEIVVNYNFTKRIHNTVRPLSDSVAFFNFA